MVYKVMLADDEPIMRKALLTLTDWTEIGCEVAYVAENGKQVMDNIREVQPDILITDIRMPGYDGIQLARHIWEEKLPVKVIILTAFADFSYAQSAVKYGVVDYVTKNGVFDGLVAAVAEAQKQLQKERSTLQVEERGILVENVFKSVLDGSLYEEHEIVEGFQRAGIVLENYLVVLMQFCITDEKEKKGSRSIFHSLSNFLKMVFTDRIIQIIPVDRDMYAVVLNDVEEAYEEGIARQCSQIVDMTDNFMKLQANLGVSRKYLQIQNLKAAYEEAEKALDESILSRNGKIVFSRGTPKEEYKNKKEMLIQDSLKYIDENYEDNILVGDIAHFVGASPSYLSRIFKESTGQTLINTMNIKKLDKAKEYLRHTDMKVYEIAEKLGFENTTYFSHFFKKYTGQSPKDW